MITKHSTAFTVMPQHSNYMSMVFGGEMLSRIDICAAECVRRFLYSSPVKLYALTVKVDVEFHIGAEIGDIVFLEAEIESVGIKSITTKVVGYRETSSGKRDKICSGNLRFVTKDSPQANKAYQHNLNDVFKDSISTIDKIKLELKRLNSKYPYGEFSCSPMFSLSQEKVSCVVCVNYKSEIYHIESEPVEDFLKLLKKIK